MQKHCTIKHKDTGVFLVNEQKTKWVTIITLFTMVVEVVVGYWSGSMSLLADGWHMASHALALGLSVFVYFLYRHHRFRSAFTFGGGKILSLGGYTSALFLLMIAGSMIYESVIRFSHTHEIHYQEALIVAVIGLFVNLVCALILHNEPGGHHHHHHDHHGHKHEHGEHCHHPQSKLAPVTHHHSHEHAHSHSHSHLKDLNHESAYFHILTDAVTSLLAIVALLLGMWKGWSWLDPAVGVVGGLVVIKWSFSLISQTGKDLLDAHEVSIDMENLIKKIEQDGSKVMDIHLWKLAPDQIGCELIIQSNSGQKSSDYRDVIQRQFDIHHLIIEVV
jgi:cation diffusion facilitator family transporter